jgi:hypothetical protein
MSDQSEAAPKPISVDQLTEAITSGVLRALSAQTFVDKDRPVNMAQLAAERGIFSQIVITCGSWPTGKESPVIGSGLPNTIVAGGGAGGEDQGTLP